jgi:hypothetical protein
MTNHAIPAATSKHFRWRHSRESGKTFSNSEAVVKAPPA